MDEKMIGMVVGGVFLVIFSFLMYLLFKKTAIMLVAAKKAKQAHKAKMLSMGATNYICAEHMAGLPIAQSAVCTLYLCEDKIVFERNERSYNLLKDKIVDITIKTDTQIQKAYVSSAGGAVSGGLIFGSLGASIGGRIQEKTNKFENRYLIFTYDRDGQIDFISFDVTKSWDAYKFVDYFSKIPQERRETTL